MKIDVKTAILLTDFSRMVAEDYADRDEIPEFTRYLFFRFCKENGIESIILDEERK